eukprot:9011106-Pyramimonas_sp.AAC.1
MKDRVAQAAVQAGRLDLEAPLPKEVARRRGPVDKVFQCALSRTTPIRTVPNLANRMTQRPRSLKSFAP